jgi:hypothetical protein
MPSARTLTSLITRIQNDFLDIPRLTMTLDEAQTRFSVDRGTCEALLGVLVDATVLARTPDGAFVRFFPHGAHRIATAA